MKLLSYLGKRGPTFGAVKDDGIVELGDRFGYRDLRLCLERDDIAKAREVFESVRVGDISLNEVKFLPPIIEPRKIIGVGFNYQEHAAETGIKTCENPTLFLRTTDTLVGNDSPILRPINSNNLDFEGELAVVIGKGGRHISAVDGLKHVAGFACFNDASVRDWQFHSSQVMQGKNFPQTGGFGPYLTTTEEAPPVNEMRLKTRLNGQVMQDASVADMIFKIDQIIAYCSGFTRLSAGDVILTGSPVGAGHRRNPKIFMKPGDTIEIEISGVGRLINSIEDEPGQRTV